MQLNELGIASMVLLSGVMALVFISYVRRVLDRIEDVGHIKPLIERVERLVDKVERIFTTLEVMKQTTQMEIDQLKERIRRLEEKFEED